MKKMSSEIENMPSLELAQLLSKAALDKKAENLVILDVKELSSFTDYFVIMSGRSTRHVQGLAEAVDAVVSKKRIKDANTEGLKEGLWVLLDYEDVVVHIFYRDVRDFYDLEGLWHDAARIEVRGDQE